MNTGKKENTGKELSLDRMEKVCGGGLISKSYDPFNTPGPKLRKRSPES